MSGFFVFDVETLCIVSISVCLSLAMVYCDPEVLPENNDEAYSYLLNESIFVKFNAKEQVNSEYKPRSINSGTLDWWEKQGDVQKKASFIPNKELDMLAIPGLQKLKKFWLSFPNHKELPIWTRGSLDQLILESLQRTFGVDPFIPYNCYRDVRTAIDLIYSETSKGGYVDIPDFDKYQVVKHHPTHDCAFDALQLVRGQQ
jgi:hypothetical protein